MENFKFYDEFIDRHIGPGEAEIKEMLDVINVDSVDSLINETVPAKIRLKKNLDLPEAVSEFEFQRKFSQVASKNKIYKSYIGCGYHPVILPKVIQRNILENPGWYTQYTPYQAEISQGRLEALLNFQTVITDLTGLPIANASLLDEGTAAAEAMLMCFSLRKNKQADTLLVADTVFKQTIDVIITRAEPMNIKVVIEKPENFEFNDNVFALMVQYPDKYGEINNFKELFDKAHGKNVFNIVAADIMSLILLTPPGEFGADVAVGNTQRFGVPMMFGGPHAAYFAVSNEFKRFIPGRIIGISIDKSGNKAYRMALQTREQHIKREKATSNICTSQVLLAIMASMYAVYHGPCGLTAIATRINKLTKVLSDLLINENVQFDDRKFFDTIIINSDESIVKSVRERAENNMVNLFYEDSKIGISINETTTLEDIAQLYYIITGKNTGLEKLNKLYSETKLSVPEDLVRKSAFLTHKIFNSYYSETDFVRYVKSLENKDLSLTGSMTPLGSCTMKLNPSSAMYPISYSEMTDIHPFVPSGQIEGYREIIDELGKYLCTITGFSGITFQPNSGAQGEYTGLMIIRKYHIYNKQSQRNIVLIPSSAHGTNPASAVMAGMKVMIVSCDSNGNIDLDDLKKKAEENTGELAALMVTYPSTHGVFEENIIEICEIIHSNGGQVYMDGANMNAQVGLTSPAVIGADCCHLNLHKTFAIPHGGGGPGAGPVTVAKHLVEFLPGHVFSDKKNKNNLTAVSSAEFGSAGILPIPFAYILMSGGKEMKKATEIAILNANYIKARLEKYYPVLYSGSKGRVAHELIFDLRDIKHSCNVDVEDVAKRLMDYGFHAPTVSFPVHGTLMVEPTESEPKKELDRFCDAMISIRNEIKEVEEGKISDTDNVLKNAPHTAFEISSEEWNHPYSREKAVFPLINLKTNKFWPPVGRINNAYGDRNLVCSCLPASDYEE